MSNANRSYKKGMDTLQSGQVLEIHVTDKGAKNDLSAWAKSAGHEMIDMAEEGDVLNFGFVKREKHWAYVPMLHTRSELAWTSALL